MRRPDLGRRFGVDRRSAACAESLPAAPARKHRRRPRRSATRQIRQSRRTATDSARNAPSSLADCSAVAMAGRCLARPRRHHASAHPNYRERMLNRRPSLIRSLIFNPPSVTPRLASRLSRRRRGGLSLRSNRLRRNQPCTGLPRRVISDLLAAARPHRAMTRACSLPRTAPISRIAIFLQLVS